MLDYKVMDEVKIDYIKGIQRFGGKEALFEKYLLKFLEDDHFSKAVKAYEEGDNQQLLEAAHALKGITGIIGMDDLYTPCTEIVQSIRSDETAHLPEQINILKDAYERYYCAVMTMK